MSVSFALNWRDKMNKLFKGAKKGAFGLTDLPGIALAVVVTTVVFAIGLVILASLQANTTVSSNTAANAAVAKGITALGEIPNNWLLLIVVVIAAAVVLGIVIYNLAGNMGRR